MTASPAAALSIQNVHKRYGDLQALKGVSFDIQAGEFFGLLGPNGAGKSTLINCIAGLVRKDAGQIGVLGHDNVTAFRQARMNLGVVPQELIYDPFFTVAEVLRLQAGYYGKKPAEVADWIEDMLTSLDLQSKRDVRMRALSGGMKRRVLIAQALVHKPPVVILDEPTAGVDVELRRALWTFTRRLHEQGHTIVLTTHYLEEAEELCDRIAILSHGELKALESKQAILSRHPFRLLQLSTQGEVAVPESLKECVLEQQGESLKLRLHKDEQPVGDVLDALRDAGVRIVDVRTAEPNLEDVFVELTGMSQ